MILLKDDIGFMVNLALTVSLLSISGGLPEALPMPPVQYESVSVPIVTTDEQRFVELANQERAKAGLHPLTIDHTLVETARAHSDEMYSRKYFAHQSPTESLKSPMKRYLARVPQLPSYAMVGENLFYCSRVDVDRGQYALMNSPTHRANILNPRYDHIGVGIVIGKDGSFWVTQMFLTNRSPETTVAVNSSSPSVNATIQ